jgi:hypothetical protein
MNPKPDSACRNVIAIADEPHHHVVIDSEWVRAYAVEIGAGESTLCHQHALPYLMYVAGEAQILNTPRNGDSERQHFSPDYCDVAPAGLEHVVENLGNSPFRNLIFELLPATEKLRRPGLGFTHVAGVTLRVLYSGPVVCAQLVELQSGSQVQVTGAAIVCSPYENAVEFISPEQGTCKLERFHQMEFLAKGSTALMRCESGGPARALLVTLGCE